ncbi:MAG TPA: S26 family signal peptidase [Pirellulales bacterium]|nr:S26 family signal peptidase [Pirellulales bacterium]
MAVFESTRRRKTRRTLLRQAVEGGVGLLIAGLLSGTWLAQRFVVPSGSMAETLLGEHRRLTCDDCGHEFDCGADLPAMAGKRAVCPNCDFLGQELAAAEAIDGDRLLVYKTAFAVRPPRRWEMAAFRNPEAADEMLVKRVAGLPRETIEIRHGDVYANGEIQRKTLDELRSLAILVYDANAQLRRTPQLPPRWQGESDLTRWQAADGRFWRPAASNGEPAPSASGLCGATATSGNRGADAPRSPGAGAAGGELDWLTYRHWRRRPGSPAEADEAAITDRYGYNQARAVVETHPVRDLMLSCRIRSSGPGSVVFFLTDGQSQFLLEWQVERRRAVLKADGLPVAEAGDLPAARGQSSRLELALVDQQVLLAFDGRVVLSHAYRPTTAPFRPTSRPIAVASEGAEIELWDLKLFRDIYYTAPESGSLAAGRIRGEARQYRLGADEYFVLGDNSPLAADSRNRFGGGGVAAELLIGKPFLVYWPSRLSGTLRGFQVPDLARIRYIH